jgi:hypothetical protein
MHLCAAEWYLGIHFFHSTWNDDAHFHWIGFRENPREKQIIREKLIIPMTTHQYLWNPQVGAGLSPQGYFERTVTESRSSEDLQKVKGDWMS